VTGGLVDSTHIRSPVDELLTTYTRLEKGEAVGSPFCQRSPHTSQLRQIKNLALAMNRRLTQAANRSVADSVLSELCPRTGRIDAVAWPDWSPRHEAFESNRAVNVKNL
jgi:hypothetical protein